MLFCEARRKLSLSFFWDDEKAEMRLFPQKKIRCNLPVQTNATRRSPTSITKKMQVQGPDVHRWGFFGRVNRRKWRVEGVRGVCRAQFEVAETTEQVFVGLRFKFC
jgi:hypothetical protein